METIKKFRKEIVFGIGTTLENPEQFNNRITFYMKRFWIKYENVWYLTKLLPELNEHEIFINIIKNKCYNKEQLEAYIIEILSLNI